jgi:hypothetical protein
MKYVKREEQRAASWATPGTLTFTPSTFRGRWENEKKLGLMHSGLLGSNIDGMICGIAL